GVKLEIGATLLATTVAPTPSEREEYRTTDFRRPARGVALAKAGGLLALWPCRRQRIRALWSLPGTAATGPKQQPRLRASGESPTAGTNPAPTPGPSPDFGRGEQWRLAHLVSPPLNSGEGPGVGAGLGAGFRIYDHASAIWRRGRQRLSQIPRPPS